MNKEWGNSKFHTTSSTDAHTALLRRALSGLLFLLPLLGTPQDVAKKRAKAFPLGTPCCPPFYDKRRGFCRVKIPPSWAHKRTPKMSLRGKFS